LGKHLEVHGLLSDDGGGTARKHDGFVRGYSLAFVAYYKRYVRACIYICMCDGVCLCVCAYISCVSVQEEFIHTFTYYIDMQTDRQTNRQTDRQTDRHESLEMMTHTHMNI